jgi:hypothetical protein
MNIHIPLMRSAAILSGLVLLHSAPICRAENSYKLLTTIPLANPHPGGCLSIDEVGRRLYVPLENEVAVIDLAKHQVVARTTNTPGVQCFTVAPRFRRGFFTTSEDSLIHVLDLRALRTVSKLPSKGPGGVIFEPVRGGLFVLDREERTMAAYEADDGDFEGTTTLPGVPGVAVADSKGHLYCSIEDKNEIVVVNTGSRKIAARWPLPPEGKVSAMALDPVSHQLILAYDTGWLRLVDTNSGKFATSIRIGDKGGAIALDLGARLIFCCCGDRALTIVHADGPNQLKVAQKLEAPGHIEALAVDSTTHRLYLTCGPSTPPQEPPSGSAGGEPQRTSQLTSGILVYGQNRMSAPL